MMRHREFKFFRSILFFLLINIYLLPVVFAAGAPPLPATSSPEVSEKIKKQVKQVALEDEFGKENLKKVDNILVDYSSEDEVENDDSLEFDEPSIQETGFIEQVSNVLFPEESLPKVDLLAASSLGKLTK